MLGDPSAPSVALGRQQGWGPGAEGRRRAGPALLPLPPGARE